MPLRSSASLGIRCIVPLLVLVLGMPGPLCSQGSPGSGTQERPKPATEYKAGLGAWVQFRGDQLGSGVSHSKVPDFKNMKVKWRYWTGSNQSGAPALAEGKVIVGTEAGDLHAIHVDSGKKAWTSLVSPRETGKGIVFCSPFVYDGSVYIGNKVGMVSCVRLKDGEILWQKQMEGEDPRIYSSPTGDHRGIVFGVADRQNGSLVCLDPKTGKQRWVMRALREIGASPAIFGDSVFVTSKDRHLYEVSFKTGKVVREWLLPGTTHCSPTIAFGMVFLSVNSGELVAVDLATGDKLWTVEGNGLEKIGPSCSSKTLVFPTARGMSCRDPLTGMEKWLYTTRYKTSGALLCGANTLFTTSTGLVEVLGEDGKKVCEFDLGEPFISNPILVDGVLYCGSGGMKGGYYVYALE